MEETDVDDLVVGRGVQGVTLATLLLARGCASRDRFAIIDPRSEPLTDLSRRLKECLATHLRSDPFDHVAPDRNSLLQWAEAHQRMNAFVTDRRRPCVNAFIEHSRWVDAQHQLAQLLTQAMVTGFRRHEKGGIHVTTDRGCFRTKRLYLALGMNAPDYPEWASRPRGHNPRICHVFDDDFHREELPKGDTAMVIGGGITGAQVAAALSERGDRHVTYITRSPLTRGEGRSSSAEWYDPQRRARLCALPWPERMALLQREGDRGTVPEWEHVRLDRCRSAGTLSHRIDAIAHLVPSDDEVSVLFRNGAVQRVNQVVVATGLKKTFHDWIVASAREMGLPFTVEGEPQLENNLEWHPRSGVFMLGHHANPVLGPYGANISGGRIAADLICCHLADR